MSLECLRLFVSCLCAGQARAFCSSVFIDDCVFCHRRWEAGLDPSRKGRRDVATNNGQSLVGFLHCSLRRFQPSRTREYLTVCFSGADSQSYRRCSPSKGPLGRPRSKMKLTCSELACREPWAAFCFREQWLNSPSLCRRGFADMSRAQSSKGKSCWVRVLQFRQEFVSIFPVSGTGSTQRVGGRPHAPVRVNG